jgi:adenylate cyclase
MQEEELTIKNFEYIDLKGRSLRTVPVVLYANADSIIMLNLSRNPILEIPLDFIQSCTTLRELRLSQMAMKKVPQSVRHSATLRHLDLSSNRIVDLNDAGLDRLTELTSLSLQNNRMEKLPWYFPRLRTLKTLNISNNKFLKFPDEVNKLGNLLDLDISFNMIAELPEQIGQLVSLEMLTIVGNEVMRFPDECSELGSLRVLDCRRNHITDLSVMCMLPKLGKIFADYNDVHSLDLSLGPSLNALHVSHNDITQLTLIPGPVGRSPYALTTLDISHAKLSSLDGLALAQLTSLRILKADHNSFRFMPDSLGELTYLVDLSCSDNQLDTLPASIGRLQNLQTLDVHNNNLTELPASLWSCSALVKINVTSNLLNTWHDPPLAAMPTQLPNSAEIILSERTLKVVPDRKTSLPGPDRKPSEAGTIGIGRALPPLAHSLQWLYLGENRIPNDALHPLMIFKELRILNLSFNDIQVMPPSFFKNLTNLEEMYLSGNQLSSIPTEDLHRLKKLSVLFLNGNHLQSLPHELGKVKSLNALDVGSNMLKYNINNWEFDWNWYVCFTLRAIYSNSLSKEFQPKLEIPQSFWEQAAGDQAGRRES